MGDSPYVRLEDPKRNPQSALVIKYTKIRSARGYHTYIRKLRETKSAKYILLRVLASHISVKFANGEFNKFFLSPDRDCEIKQD